MKTAENIVDQNFRSDYWLDRMMIINSAAKNIVIEAMEEYADQYKSKWISVETEPSIELYYQLAMHDDVYLDVFKYRSKGIDGNSCPYFRSVNDNSTMDISEISHYKEFLTDAPDWFNPE